MELVFIWGIIGCIPAAIAKSKGRSFFTWWVYGALLFIVALIHSLVINKDIRAIEDAMQNEGFVRCPYCAEMVKTEAVKCKHCGSDISGTVKAVHDFTILPSDMVVDDFYTRKDGACVLNDYSVEQVVARMKSANPGIHPINLRDKYEKQVSEIVSKLPMEVRDSFTQVYARLL